MPRALGGFECTASIVRDGRAAPDAARVVVGKRQEAVTLEVCMAERVGFERDAGALPGLKASMTGLIGRMAPRRGVPVRPGTQDPRDAVQHRAGVGEHAAAPIGT